jgi:hypothetical protein
MSANLLYLCILSCTFIIPFQEYTSMTTWINNRVLHWEASGISSPRSHKIVFLLLNWAYKRLLQPGLKYINIFTNKKLAVFNNYLFLCSINLVVQLSDPRSFHLAFWHLVNFILKLLQTCSWKYALEHLTFVLWIPLIMSIHQTYVNLYNGLKKEVSRHVVVILLVS